MISYVWVLNLTHCLLWFWKNHLHFLIFYLSINWETNFVTQTICSANKMQYVECTDYYTKDRTKSCPTFGIPWTVAHQALLSMGFSKQEYWSGLPFPSPEELPDPGIEHRSPGLQTDALLTELPPYNYLMAIIVIPIKCFTFLQFTQAMCI